MPGPTSQLAPAAPPPAAVRPAPDRRAQLTLATVMAGAFIALLDTTIVNVALPSVQHGLGASDSALEWIVSGYALAFGLALIPAGRLGDAIGRKPLYLAGLVVFLLASLAAGISRNADQLVAARIVQGIAAGVYYTQINATIVDTFSGARRSKAFGVLAAVIGLSTAIGPLAGGVLISAFGGHSGWRWIFFVNLLIGAVAVPAAIKFMPAPVRRPRQRADLAGVTALTVALLLILVPLIEGQTAGWPLWTYLCFAAAVPVLVSLALWELRVERSGRVPLIPPHVVRRPAFATGGLFALLYFASFTSIFFSLAVTWQDGFGHSALATGLLVSPFAIGAIVTARKSHAVAARLGDGVLVLGTAVVCAGLIGLLLAFRASGQPDVWYLVGPLLIAGLGHGLIVAPNADLVLKSVPPADNGSASGVLNTAQRIGSALGIALVGTVLFGTLHPAGHSAVAVASAFGHSVQAALLVNIGLIVATLALALISPWLHARSRAMVPVAAMAAQDVPALSQEA
jgi:EmrB/QacA subfamily drug resistance transporter